MPFANHSLCGRVGYTILKPLKNGTRPIKMDDAWEDANIVTITVPQLVGVDAGNGPNFNGKIRFHKKGVYQLLKAFEEVEAKGLKPLLLSFAGAFYPRMIRGSTVTPSEHSFGTAFDINAGWNGLGRTPAKTGTKGSVRELVAIFEKWGFTWGGIWKRADGMHFQIARWITATASPKPVEVVKEIVRRLFLNGKPFKDARMIDGRWWVPLRDCCVTLGFPRVETDVTKTTPEEWHVEATK